jgi:hypothetical protein
MPFWRITPAAQPDDPRWMGDRVWEEVVVRAPIAASARVAAAEMEARLNPQHTLRNHARLQATDFPSGFFDEKLYHVELTAAPGDMPEAEDSDHAMVIVAARLREPEGTRPPSP